MNDKVQFIRKIWHHALVHSHEIVVALMVEGSKGNVIMLLLLIAGLCIALAVQVYFAVED